MAKKSVKKVRKSPSKKAFKGLKVYVIIGLISVAATAVIIFISAFNSSAERIYHPAIAVVNLPETGDTTYYTNCYIDNAAGIAGYADKSLQQCTYLGIQSGGYDYSTSTALLKCTSNDLLQENVCTAGKLK